MFNTNEFNYRVDPNQAGVIILDLTKKSKRNLLIRVFVHIALGWACVPVIGVILDRTEQQLSEEFKNSVDDILPES